MRSVSLNLTAEDRRETIILNAKSLLDVDADARFFAARILLSYICEETLSWKVADGREALKEALRRAFLDRPRAIRSILLGLSFMVCRGPGPKRKLCSRKVARSHKRLTNAGQL